jgi:hypothetical protein
MITGRMSKSAEKPRFAQLSEVIPDKDRPPLDRRWVRPFLGKHQAAWRRDGVLRLDGLIPADLIDAYVSVREKVENPHGWSCPVPYIHIRELRDVCLHPPLVKIIGDLLGEPPVLNLNLTGWVSTERKWHQDDYLNPSHVNGRYIAAWIALDDISPDCGPFEYVAGSNRWPTLRGDKVRQFLTPDEAAQEGRPTDTGHWAEISEAMVAAAIEEEIAKRDAKPTAFLGKKGDVLLWHACTMHRGAAPTAPGMKRPALIAHYSTTSRKDFAKTNIRTAEAGGLYHYLDIPLA